MLSRKSRRYLGLLRQPTWKAGCDVNPTPDSNYRWQATGPDPYLFCNARYWLPGWYMLELEVEHNQPLAQAELFFSSGKKDKTDNKILLPVPSRKTVKRLLYIPADIKTVRLDPLSDTGSFSIIHCRFVWVKPSFAKNRLCRRLTQAYPGHKKKSFPDIIYDIKTLAKKNKENWKVTAINQYHATFDYNNNYKVWLKQQAEVNTRLQQKQQEQQPTWRLQPIISVLLPVYNTPPALLVECINSVKQQVYPHWQLCIADDASTSEHTRQTLRQLCDADERIKLSWRFTNGHISAASNTALELATGDYVALLDHDDLLAPNALLQVAETINEYPNALFFYSDEDKINEYGERYDPHFKPDWNPDLLLSQNYISHLGVYERQRLMQLGGFREGLEGSQDHDLVLRFTQGLNTSQIVHIPHVLYHWRAVAGSTAVSGEEKGYAQIAGENAIRDFLKATGSQAWVSAGRAPNSYRVCWPLPAPLPLVSLLVPTRNGIDILQPCVDAILERTEYRNFELLILDNQSSCLRTLAYMREVSQRDDRVRVLKWDYPFNYSAINNFGARYANGSILGLINNDIEPINNSWLDEMVSQVCRPEIGCVGAKLYYPNNTIQHAGVTLGIGGLAGHSHKHFNGNAAGYFYRLQLVQNFSAVTAACLLVRKAVFEEVRGLNEEHLKVAFNDVDLCLKVQKAGYRNLWTPYAELYHHESVSRGAEDTPEKQARYQKEITYMRNTWGPLLDNDPAYNPNLTLAYEDFSLRNISSGNRE